VHVEDEVDDEDDELVTVVGLTVVEEELELLEVEEELELLDVGTVVLVVVDDEVVVAT